MDNNEYQQTIEELEKRLRVKQEELDGISARKAAIQLKGMAGLTGQVAELALLNKQLENAKDQYEEVEQKVGRINELEKIMAVQQDEITRLSAENTALKLKIVTADVNQEAKLQVEDTQQESWKDEKTALENQIDQLRSKLDEAEEKAQREEDLETGSGFAENTVVDSQRAESQRADSSLREEKHEPKKTISTAKPVRATAQNSRTTISPLLPHDILHGWIDK